MNCSRDFFIGCLGGGLEDYPHDILLTNDLALFHKNDIKPFGELIFRKGKTILRIGDVDTNGIKVIV